MYFLMAQALLLGQQVDAQGGSVTVGTDVWFDVQITADLDGDLGRIYLNGVAANEWQWSLNNANGNAGSNALAAVDFYGTNTAGGAGNYYIDDVQVVESYRSGSEAVGC